MKALIAALVLVTSLPALGQGAPRPGPNFDALTAKFFRDLACRETTVSVGRSTLFALRTGRLSGAGTLDLFDARKPAEPLLSESDDPSVSIFWPRNGDFIYNDGSFFWLTQSELARGRHPDFHAAWAQPFVPLVSLPDDVLPSQVESRVVLAGSGGSRTLLLFSPESGNLAKTGIAIGLDNTLVWDGRDGYLRVQRTSSSVRLEIFRQRVRRWVAFSALRLPQDARVILLRRDADGRFQAGILVPGRDSDDVYAVLDEGAARVRTVARGQIAEPLLSPDGRDFYGYVDRSGAFHRVADEPRSPAVSFWLRRFAASREFEDFAFLENGEYAVVRRWPDGYAPRIDVMHLERGGRTETAMSFCSGASRGVGKILQHGNDILFAPSVAATVRRKPLVVYLHGGPVAFIDRRGHWLTDLFNLAGYPVLAVNYSGSLGVRAPESADLLARYGDEIADGIAFAEKAIGSGPRPPIFVADSFGSLVGLAAIAAGRARPSEFVVLDGVVDPLELDWTGSDVLGRRYPRSSSEFLARTSRELARRVDPQKIARSRTRFLFVHGEKDERIPLHDIRQFVARYNAATGVRKASLVVVPGMYHEPDFKPQVKAILRALRSVLTRG